jgi:hypothetical protein
MFIVLLDEPGLCVFDSPEAAVQAIEPPDAENEVRAAFSDDGVPYSVEWIRPNQHNALFGEVGVVQFGEYRFAPAGPPDIAGLIALLEDHPDYRPDFGDALVELLRKLRAAAAIEYAPETQRRREGNRDF